MVIRISEICKKFPNVNIIMRLQRPTGDALQLSQERYYIEIIIKYKDEIRLLETHFKFSQKINFEYNYTKLNNSVTDEIKLFIAEVDKNNFRR